MGLIANRNNGQTPPFGKSYDQLSGRRFELGPAGVLETAEIFHHYPGKRALLHATLDGRPVVAKFFLAPLGQAWEWWRSVRGSRALMAAGVPAPALRFAGFCPAARAWLTVLDRIEVDEPWPPTDDDHLEPGHRRLLESLACHHAAGIVQNDLNWLNFIPHGGVLYAVDGERIRGQRRPLNRRQALAHLVRLYALKSRLPETVVRDGLRHYLAQRQWLLAPTMEEDFIRQVQDARRRHAERVARRACHGWKHYPRQKYDGLTIIRDRRRLDIPEVDNLLTALRNPVADAAAEGLLELGGRMVRWWRLTAPLDHLPARRWRRCREACRIWVALLTAQRLDLQPERHLALILPGSHHQGLSEPLLIQEAEVNQPLPTVLAVLSPIERGRVLEQLQIRLRCLRVSRITLDGVGLEGFGWNGRNLLLRDPRALRCHPWWQPGFAGRWRAFQERLQTELAAHIRPTAV